MIELAKVVIDSSDAPKEGVSISFDNGINHIDYSQKYLFNFLCLRNQIVDRGEFKVNNEVFYPKNRNGKSFFVLAINSQVFSMTIFVISNEDKKRETLKSLQDELVSLRDMPLESLVQKANKIQSMLDVVSHYDIGYVLIDNNNDVNAENIPLIEGEINKRSNDFVFIILNKGTNEEIKKELEVKEEPVEPIIPTRQSVQPFIFPEETTFFNIGGYDEEYERYLLEKKAPKKKFRFERKKKEEKPQVAKQVQSKSSEGGLKDALARNALPILKHELVSLFLFMLETTFAVGISILGPYLFSVEGASFGAVMMIILLTVCIISTLFIGSSFMAQVVDKPHKDNKAKFIILLAYLSIASILGIIFGYVLISAFRSGGFIIKAEQWSDDNYKLSIAISIVMFIIPFVSKYVHMFTNFIKRKLNG